MWPRVSAGRVLGSFSLPVPLCVPVPPGRGNYTPSRLTQVPLRSRHVSFLNVFFFFNSLVVNYHWYLTLFFFFPFSSWSLVSVFSWTEIFTQTCQCMCLCMCAWIYDSGFYVFYVYKWLFDELLPFQWQHSGGRVFHLFHRVQYSWARSSLAHGRPQPPPHFRCDSHKLFYQLFTKLLYCSPVILLFHRDYKNMISWHY